MPNSSNLVRELRWDDGSIHSLDLIILECDLVALGCYIKQIGSLGVVICDEDVTEKLETDS